MGRGLRAAEPARRSPTTSPAAFAAEPGAREFFDSLDSRNRFAVLNRFGSVTRPETRARKAVELAAMMARHEKPHA